MSQGITKDIEAAITLRSFTDIYLGKSRSCWCIIYGWFYCSTKSCSFKPKESDAAAHFCRGTAGRVITANGRGRSVGGETDQMGDAAVGARVRRAKEKAVHKAKEKAVQRAKERAVQQAKTPSSIGRNGHQSGCGRLYKKPACDRWASN